MAYRQKVAASYNSDSNGTKLCFKYYIVSESATQSKAYGVSIDKYLICQDATTLVESETVAGITYSPELAISLARKLAANEVSPCTLIYVIDDIMSYPNELEPFDVDIA